MAGLRDRLPRRLRGSWAERPGHDRPGAGVAASPAGGSAVMGNHDMALVRAARLDGGPASLYWDGRYRTDYDGHATFESYLGRPARTWGDAWEKDLHALRAAMPAEHQQFLASLPWVVEGRGTSSSTAA